MPPTKEAKPPAELVEAIQRSEDGSTAPPSAGTVGATHAINARLANETLQKPPPDENNEPRGGEKMSHEEKHLAFLAAQQQQQQAQRYDRGHPGAGRAGQGDQAVDSAVGKMCDARKEQGSRHNHAIVGRHN